MEAKPMLGIVKSDTVELPIRVFRHRRSFTQRYSSGSDQIERASSGDIPAGFLRVDGLADRIYIRTLSVMRG